MIKKTRCLIIPSIIYVIAQTRISLQKKKLDSPLLLHNNSSKYIKIFQEKNNPINMNNI